MLYFLKREKLFYLLPFYLPVYLWSAIFTSIQNMKGPTGCLRFVATPWNQWRAENLGHNVIMMQFRTLIQLLIISVMKQKHWIEWVKMWIYRTYVPFFQILLNTCFVLNSTASELTLRLHMFVPTKFLWVHCCYSHSIACSGASRLGNLLDDNKIL